MTRDPAPSVALKPTWIALHEIANATLAGSVRMTLCWHGLARCPICRANAEVRA